MKKNSRSSIGYWKIAQLILWAAGVALLSTLILKPDLGITLFWNVLIPVAPALLVLGTGIWRNICPLSVTSMFADRFGISKNWKLSPSEQSYLNLLSILILFIIIPLRHIVFNTAGFETFVLLAVTGATAFSAGLFFESKSAWCSGLCPVQSVEKLYGSSVATRVENAHCTSCVRCSIPCPDSTPNYLPFRSRKIHVSGLIEFLIVGVFPGYIWGWFQVPDYRGHAGFDHMYSVYGYSLAGGMVTGIIFLLLRRLMSDSTHREVVSLFAAAAVSCYYWFRIPTLIGFGTTPSNGMLFDLSGIVSPWFVTGLKISSTLFFFWWIVFRRRVKRSWSVRPAYQQIKQEVTKTVDAE